MLLSVAFCGGNYINNQKNYKAICKYHLKPDCIIATGKNVCFCIQGAARIQLNKVIFDYRKYKNILYRLNSIGLKNIRDLPIACVFIAYRHNKAIIYTNCKQLFIQAKNIVVKTNACLNEVLLNCIESKRYPKWIYSNYLNNFFNNSIYMPLVNKRIYKKRDIENYLIERSFLL